MKTKIFTALAVLGSFAFALSSCQKPTPPEQPESYVSIETFDELNYSLVHSSAGVEGDVTFEVIATLTEPAAEAVTVSLSASCEGISSDKISISPAEITIEAGASESDPVTVSITDWSELASSQGQAAYTLTVSIESSSLPTASDYEPIEFTISKAAYAVMASIGNAGTVTEYTVDYDIDDNLYYTVGTSSSDNWDNSPAFIVKTSEPLTAAQTRIYYEISCDSEVFPVYPENPEDEITYTSTTSGSYTGIYASETNPSSESSEVKVDVTSWLSNFPDDEKTYTFTVTITGVKDAYEDPKTWEVTETDSEVAINPNANTFTFTVSKKKFIAINPVVTFDPAQVTYELAQNADGSLNADGCQEVNSTFKLKLDQAYPRDVKIYVNASTPPSDTEGYQYFGYITANNYEPVIIPAGKTESDPVPYYMTYYIYSTRKYPLKELTFPFTIVATDKNSNTLATMYVNMHKAAL